MAMILVLFRHAEKAASGFAPNPPLSGRGLKQAANLWKMIESGQLPSPRKVFVSPLTRTQQTAEVAAKNLHLPLQISTELHERLETESMPQFRSRIQKFLKWLEFQEGPVFIVTHFDWVEEAMTLIHSTTDLAQEQFSCWASGQFMQFQVADQIWILEKQGRL